MACAKQPKPVHQMTAAQFDALFKTEDDCKAYLVVRRWPQGVVCPRCGNPSVYELHTRAWHWQCTQCAPGGNTGYRFSYLTGTIFENTNKPLKDWFRVAHLMLVSKKGMSALQIYRYMGFGSYKTAWVMCHKIRTAMVEDVKQLAGIVEVDETVVGGDSGNRHWDKRSGKGNREGKPIVVGAVRRKGNVVARVIENVKGETLSAFVNEAVSHKVSLLCTDDWPGYRRLAEQGYPHVVVDHRAHQYVYGAVHTQTIEGFWSILKRGIVGTFHKVSKKISASVRCGILVPVQ
jgi:transposase-like protein/IS1 family transposase